MVFNVTRDQSLQLNYTINSAHTAAPRFQRYFDRIERAQVGFSTPWPRATRVAPVLQPVRDEVDA
jgi:hypothetical protein